MADVEMLDDPIFLINSVGTKRPVLPWEDGAFECSWWKWERVGCSQFAKTVGTPISRQDSGASGRRSATPGLKDVDYP